MFTLESLKGLAEVVKAIKTGNIVVEAGDKEAYQKFFKEIMKKYGVKSPAELSDEDKKKFFNEIEKGWKADDESKTNESFDEGAMVIEEKLDPEDDVKVWIKDFEDSDAPQFKDKDKKERAKMAVAAWLSAREKAGIKEGVDEPEGLATKDFVDFHKINTQVIDGEAIEAGDDELVKAISDEDYDEMVELFSEDLLDNHLDHISSLTEEQLDELVGKAIAVGAALLGKGAKKAYDGAKKLKHRLSVSGRATAAEEKAEEIEKRKRERERLRAAKERLAQARKNR